MFKNCIVVISWECLSHCRDIHEQSGTFCRPPLWTGTAYLCMLMYFATNHQRGFKTPSLWVLGNCFKSQMTKHSLFSDLWQQSNCGMLRKRDLSQAEWLRWLEHHPIHQKVSGSVPGGGMNGKQSIDISLSHSVSLSLSALPLSLPPSLSPKNL